MERFREKMYQVKRNQIRMMYERGYELPEGETRDLDKENFIQQYQGEKIDWEKLNNRYQPSPRATVDREPVFLFYLIRVNLKVTDKELLDNAKNMIEKMNALGETNFVIITSAIDKLSRKLAEKIDLEVKFSLIDWNLLRVDLPNQVRFPSHTLLSSEQRELLFKKFRPNNLPIMRSFDPAAIYYDAKGGQVFLIKRRNQVTRTLREQLIYYRIVVDVGAPLETEAKDDDEVKEPDFDIERPDDMQLPGADEPDE